MNNVLRLACVACLALTTASLSAQAQQSQNSQSGNQQSSQKMGQASPNAKSDVKINPKEEKAYKAFYSLTPADTDTIIKDGEDFVTKFPNSRYNSSVYAKLAQAYENKGDEQNMVADGQKSLQLDPDNVDVLAELAYALPRHINPNQLDTGQKLEEASTYAKHAIDLLGKMQKPASLTDEQFATAKNYELANCHSGLGLVNYYQQNLPGMVSELEQAVQLETKPDPTDQFLLGFAYSQTGKLADSQTMLEKCSENANPVQQRCKALLDQVKKAAAAPNQQQH